MTSSDQFHDTGSGSKASQNPDADFWKTIGDRRRFDENGWLLENKNPVDMIGHKDRCICCNIAKPLGQREPDLFTNTPFTT